MTKLPLHMLGVSQGSGSFLMLTWYLVSGTTSLVAQMVKASAYNAGDPGLIPGSGISPGEGNDNPLQYSCLENSMEEFSSWKILAWRSLAGYSPWGRKELDTTE